MDGKIKDMFEKITRYIRPPFRSNDITDDLLEKSGGRGLYAKHEIDLSSANSDMDIPISGDNLTVEDCPDAVTVKLNHRKNPEIDLQKIPEVEGPFKHLFINNAAGSGTLKFFTGDKGMFRAKKKPEFLVGPDYIIYNSGSLVKAMNGENGHILKSSSDFATAVQAAIDAKTYAERNSIFIKSGSYVSTKAIDLKGRLQIRGAGMGSTKITAADQSQDWNMMSFLPTTNELFLVLRDFSLYGDGTDGTSGHCIYCDDSAGGDTMDVQLDHIMTAYAKDVGVYMKDNWGFRMTNCISEYSGDENLKIGLVSQVYVAHCYFAYAKGTYGVRLDSTKSLFIGNNVYANEKHGILLSGGGQNIQICNNNISGNGTAGNYDGLWVDGTNHEAIIMGNGIYDNTDYGLDLDADDCIVEANNIVNNTNGQIADSGARNIINGLSNNAAVPGVGGDWITATREGVIVRDIANNKTYIYAGGAWREISAL